VVFAGDAPIRRFFVHSVNRPGAAALATGAHFVPIRTIDRALD